MAKIAAGIVLYNPDIKRLEENINHILPQVSEVVLVDNGSENIQAVLALYENNSNINIIQNQENRGIAEALNQLISYAEVNKYNWVLTLDQDSVCDEHLLKNYMEHLFLDNVGIFTPTIIDINEDNIVSPHMSTQTEDIERCITSGALTNIEACKAVGYFDSKMFIDYVDFDFCTRLIQHGYRIVRVNSAILYHEMGNAKCIKVFFYIGRLLHLNKLKKNIYTYNHSPIRTYYYVKNTVYYIRKHRKIIRVRNELYVCLRWMFLKLMFEKQRCRKLLAMMRGFRDGVRIKIDDE